MHYNIIKGKEIKVLEIDDIVKIEIAHSLPSKVDPEIADPVTWTLEYRMPIAILEKYSNVAHPEKGISWRANFFKIAENNSNPHYLTWTFVDNPVPDFHLPKFFVAINFQ